MGRAILLRHGRTTANATGVLAGRTAVALDEQGKSQAARLAEIFAGIPLAAAVSSPLLRTQQTLELALSARSDVPVHFDEALTEVDYGQWTGGALKDLANDPLWRLVQSHPSSVTFPGGESMAAMAARSAAAVRRWVAQWDEVAAGGAGAFSEIVGTPDGDPPPAQASSAQAGVVDEAETATAKAPPTANVLFVSHGDVIKAILADALGMHLDAFQRICVDPASVSVVHYVAGQPMVECLNTDGSLLRTWSHSTTSEHGGTPTGEATPGGGAGR